MKTNIANFKRTKKIIIMEFCKLLSEKSFNNITVQNILDKAEICKGTFYKYFCDKYDLANQSLLLFLADYQALLAITDTTPDFNQSAKLYSDFININKWQFCLLRNIETTEFSFTSALFEGLKTIYCKMRNQNSENEQLEAFQFATQHKMIFDILMLRKESCCIDDINNINKARKNVFSRSSLSRMVI